MFAEKQMKDATVQELQLELIRRTQHNAFDGERVVRSLLAHRELWEAALLDRDSVHNRRLLPAMGLIKLRDLDQNFWNADTLWILSPNVDSARRLQRLHDEDQWCGDEFHIFDNPEDVDNALGGAEDEQVLVRVWWD